MFHFLENSFHVADCHARQRRSAELHVQTADTWIAHRNCFRIFPRAAEEEFSQTVGPSFPYGRAGGQKERAGSVAEQPAKLACGPARTKRSAVHVRSGHQNS